MQQSSLKSEQWLRKRNFYFALLCVLDGTENWGCRLKVLQELCIIEIAAALRKKCGATYKLPCFERRSEVNYMHFFHFFDRITEGIKTVLAP